jgi:hypothetical protein
VVKGRNRDTAWFSLLDHEWPHVRVALIGGLAPANIDAQGRQRNPLRAQRSERSGTLSHDER